MCNVAIMVSTLKDKSGLPVNFIQKLPKGVPLGGQKHGWHDTHYVKFMISQIEQGPITGVKKLFLYHRNFCKNKHSEQVKAIFTRKAANTEYPFPRPVWGNTVDFAIMYKGTHLLDGECKSVDNKGHEILVIYSTQQLAWRKIALSLLPSPKSITLFKVEARPPDCG